MPGKIHVATRKGLLTFAPAGKEWRLGATAFLGDPISSVLRDPRDGALYAALNLGHFGIKLHRSEDGGATWKELPVPAFPTVDPPKEGEKGPSVSQIWTLAAGGTDQPGLLWAGTNPGGLFRSDDRGESWALVESLWSEPAREKWFGGGYNEPGIHSVCVDPRDSRRLALGISCGGVWTSDDTGATWQQGGQGLRAEYMPPNLAYDPVAQDPHRLAQCPSAPDTIWCQHHNGIFLSEDGGRNFIEIETSKPSRFGFAVAVHPRDAKTAWFVPAVKDERRVPVDQRFVVSRTRDGGKTFQILDSGLPSGPSFDLVYRHGLAVNDTGERLVMGSTTGNLWVSDTGGDSWSPISSHLPPVSQVAWALG
jgi:photosystem II stability/assembly factor-like uncharacterized protein